MKNYPKLTSTLLLSASVSAIAMIGVPVATHAGTVTVAAPVAPATSTDASVVNADIISKITVPDADLTISIAPAGVVTGGDIVLNPNPTAASKQGDGKIVFTNAGSVGTKDAATGDITDFSGVRLFGVGEAKAGNTATVTNTGLVTDGLFANSFGGDVLIANAAKGEVSGGIFGSGFADVTVSVAEDSAVRSGAVVGFGLSSASKTTPEGVTTFSAGDVKLLIDGDIVNADGTSKGAVLASTLGNADVTINGTAGAVSAFGGGTVETVFVAQPAGAAGKTVTGQSGSTIGGGTASVVIGETGAVNKVTASATGGTSVTIDGAVTGTGAVATNVSLSSSGSNSSSKSSETQNKAGQVTLETFEFTTTSAGKASNLVVGATGSIAGNTFVGGQGGASAKINGATTQIGGSGGNVTAMSLATSSAGTFSTATSYNDKGEFVSSVELSKISAAATGGVASIEVGKSGSIAGTAFANGDAGASVVNSGNIGNQFAGTAVTANSARELTTLSQTELTTFANGDEAKSTQLITESVGGTAKFENQAGGLIQGGVSLSSVGDVTVINNGVVRGATTATSTGTKSVSTSAESTTNTVATGKAPAPDIKTTVTKSSSALTETLTGGSVTGTYAGANGFVNFDTSVDGTVTQTANKASTVNVTGAVSGDIFSEAGSGVNLATTSESVETRVLSDEALPNGTISSSSKSTSKSSSASGGDSKVIISGVVGRTTDGASRIVDSQGTDSSSVTVNGGTVFGGINSEATVRVIEAEASETTEQTVTKGAVFTTGSSESLKYSDLDTGGAASVELTGSSSVAGEVDVFGVAAASAKISAGSKIGTTLAPADLFVMAGGIDITYSTSTVYSADSKADTASQTDKFSYTGGTAKASGNATADIAGTLSGSAFVNSGRGNATTAVSGTVEGDVSVSANGSSSVYNEQTDLSGKPFDLAETKFTSASTTAALGGKAELTVDTAAALKDVGAGGIAGNVSVSGKSGASVTVAAGSKVGSGSGNSVAVDSTPTNYSSTYERITTGTGVTETLTYTDTLSGAGALFTNAGTATGSAFVDGTTEAGVVNSGKIGTRFGGNAVEVSTLGSNSSGMITTTDDPSYNPALRTEVTKVVNTAVGGVSTLTNTASGLIEGSVSLAGKTGTLTNDGLIVGTTTLGASAGNATVTTTRTASSTKTVITPPTELFAQTYTVNQNSLSGGFIVGGVFDSVFNPETGLDVDVLTSKIDATINLNPGSVTLGSIVAEQGGDGAFLTNTTVNLNGSGFLGVDYVTTVPASPLLRTPTLTPSKAATDAGIFSTTPGGFVTSTASGLLSPTVRVLGVTELNKTGAGTFVITGAQYVEPEASALPPTWTFDVGSFNNKAGETQLTLGETSGINPEFGIKGNIVNSATLVLGRRVPTRTALIGDSLTSTGPETIRGITIRQVGNFTQDANGTLVVGLNPSLVRFGPLGVNTGGTSTEVLGPIQAGVNIPFFTTPANAVQLGGTASSTPSQVNVTGDVNLAGKVAVDVTRDSIFLTGDGYTLFTYTGAGTVSATVAPSLASSFVTFGLNNNTTAKTVDLTVTRKSYATGATNPNAVSAATALDTALASAVSRIRSDANGGAGFASVSEIGRAQDIANISAGLDWRLSAMQASQVFDELSSAEIYSSLAAVDQNAVFITSVGRLAARRSYGEALGTRLWLNPASSFATYGGTSSGASKIKVNTYGGAGGLDVAYSDTGAFGFGFGYGQHDVTAKGSPEESQVRTFTIGVYATQGFGPFYGSAQFAYGFSKFDTERDLMILARTVTGSFKGKQLDASVEVGYDFEFANFVATPFGRLAARRWSLNGFTEEGGAGIGLAVAGASKTVFSPVLGVKLGGLMGDADGFAVRPYGKLSYTFQGDLGSERSVAYLGGGDAFLLNGVDPDGYALIEAGVDASINRKVGVFLSTGYGFGGQQKVGQVRGGVSFDF